MGTSLIALGTLDGTVVEVDLQARSQGVRQMLSGIEMVSDLHWSPDGSTLYVIERSGRLSAIDSETGDIHFRAHQCHSLSVHPHLSLIATGGPAGNVRLFDGLSGEELVRLSAPRSGAV